MYSNKEIESYMQSFNLDRETALKELEEIWEDQLKIQNESMEDLYADIKRSMR